MSALPLTTAMPATDPVRAVRRARRRRVTAVVICLAIALIFAFVAAMILGDYPVPPLDVLRTLASPLTGSATPGVDFIVLELRLPRALLAMLCGAAFGASGLIFQTLLRNPLASPDIIGIARGASTAAVFAIIVLNFSGWALAGSALVGAFASALLIYLLAWRDRVSPYRVVLVGIGVEAVLVAVVSWLFTSARIFDVQQALGWLVGSLNAASLAEAGLIATGLVVLVPVAVALVRSLKTMELGDDAAIALGTLLEPARLGLILVGVAFAALPTALVGPVAFVAFVSGPIATRLAGPGTIPLVPAMLVGALVMLGADLAGQHALPGLQLPVGIVTGLFGALFLLALLASTNRRGRA